MVNIKKVFERAADVVMKSWYYGQWDYISTNKPDLVNNLWEWYLETPSTQKKMADLNYGEAIKTAIIRANQILSATVDADSAADGKNLYSQEMVKEAMKGESKNKALLEYVEAGMCELGERAPQYCDAITERYVNGRIPAQGKDAQRVTDALEALTLLVNREYRKELQDDNINPARRKVSPEYSPHAVNPETRRQKNRPADPTGNVGLALALGHEPEGGLHVTNIKHFLAGQKASQVVEIGGRRFRLEPNVQEYLLNHPLRVDAYAEVLIDKWS